MTTSLLLLFPTILVPILSDWVKPEDLFFLDSAVSSHGIREVFLSYLQKCVIRLNCKERYQQERAHKWILLRGLGLKNVNFVEVNGTPSNFSLFILRRTVRLDSLSATISTKLLEQIVASGVTVNSLTLRSCGNSDNDLLLDILRALQGVIHLDISSFYTVEANTYAKIMACCPNLKTVQLSSGVADVDLSGFFANDITVHVNHMIKKGSSSVDFTQVVTSNSSSILRMTMSSPEDTILSLLPSLYGIQSVSYSRSKNRNTNGPELPKMIAQNATHLTYLSAYRLEFGEEDLQVLFKHASKLTYLRLDNCWKITDDDVMMCALNCTLLQTFFLTTRVTEATKKYLLDSCTNLTNVDIVVHTPNSLAMLVQGVGSLAISYNVGGLSWKLKPTRALRSVAVTISKQLDKEDFRMLFSMNPQLEIVELWNQEVNTEVLTTLTTRCPLLRKLVVGDSFFAWGPRDLEKPPICLSNLAPLNSLCWVMFLNVNIPDASLECLLEASQNLVRLYLRQCFGYSGKLLHSIGRLRPNIRELMFVADPNIVSEDVKALLEACKALEGLELHGCRNVTAEVIPCIKLHGKVKVNLGQTGITEQELLNYPLHLERWIWGDY